MSAADGVHGVICKELTITLEIVLSNVQSVRRSWNWLRAVKHHHTRWRSEARGASGATTSCNMTVHKAGKMFGYMESIHTEARHKQQNTQKLATNSFKVSPVSISAPAGTADSCDNKTCR